MENKEIRIENLESLVHHVIEIDNFWDGQIWWRGQESYDWKLEPSTTRKKDGGFEYEQNSIIRFMRKASSRYPNVPPRNDLFSWLFLMRHHGLRTRLLDWTESPLVACYFAVDQDDIKVSEEKDDCDGAIFALSPYLLNENQIGIKSLVYPPSEYHLSSIDSLEDKCIQAVLNAFRGNDRDVDFIIGILANEIDIRQMTQLSVFTVHGSGKILDDIKDSEKFLRKFKIPKEAKKVIRAELKSIGIRESILFPDLDHLAKEIETAKFRKPTYRAIFTAESEILHSKYPNISPESST